jgi:hypothetical protein
MRARGPSGCSSARSRANLEVAIGSYPFFYPRTHPTKVVRHARDAQKLGIANARSRTYGENMGSSPLGSANDFSILVPKIELSPAGISNFSPMDGASDDLFEVTL